MTPFSNKTYAEKRFYAVSGAFAISQVSGQEGWWIVAKDKYGVYQIHGTNGNYPIDPINNDTFASLESRTTVEPTINNSEVIV